MTVDEAKLLLRLRFDHELGTHFELHRVTIGQWRKVGSIPRGYAAQVELAAIKAGNMRVQAETVRA